MSKRALIIILGLALAIAASITLSHRAEPPAFEMLEPQSGASSSQELPRLWQIPEFTLFERSGAPFTLAQLRGHIWVADFFYTSCPGPCTTLSAHFAQLQKELAGNAELRFVSISSDPEKDTPEVLREYANRFHATDRWSFLTGEKAAVYQLANEGFKVVLKEDPSSTAEPIAHSLKFILVDGAGTVRGVYDGLKEEGKGKLLRDLQTLQEERP